MSRLLVCACSVLGNFDVPFYDWQTNASGVFYWELNESIQIDVRCYHRTRTTWQKIFFLDTRHSPPQVYQGFRD